MILYWVNFRATERAYISLKGISAYDTKMAEKTNRPCVIGRMLNNVAGTERDGTNEQTQTTIRTE